MKTLILLLTAMTLNANAYEFKSHYEDFSYGEAYSVKNKKIVERRGPRNRTLVRGITFKIDGTIASCGALSLGEIFPRYKVKVLSCNDTHLDLSIQYKRVAACDQAMIKDGKRFTIKLPKNCRFNADTGNIIVNSH